MTDSAEHSKPTPEQAAMFDRINSMLRTERAGVSRLSTVKAEGAA